MGRAAPAARRRAQGIHLCARQRLLAPRRIRPVLHRAIRRDALADAGAGAIGDITSSLRISRQTIETYIAFHKSAALCRVGSETKVAPVYFVAPLPTKQISPPTKPFYASHANVLKPSG